MTHTQTIVLLVEVGVVAGVQFLSWVGLSPRRRPGP